MRTGHSTRRLAIAGVADVDASSSSVVKVTIQTTANDKDFGEKVARGVYNFTNSKFPDIEWVQVNNAKGDVLANTRFG